jgi:hypothetical protein
VFILRGSRHGSGSGSAGVVSMTSIISSSMQRQHAECSMQQHAECSMQQQAWHVEGRMANGGRQAGTGHVCGQ